MINRNTDSTCRHQQFHFILPQLHLVGAEPKGHQLTQICGAERRIHHQDRQVEVRQPA